MRINEKCISSIVVDDERSSCLIIDRFISERPELKQADFAANGGEAIEKINKNHYDILFLDIRLPDMSGVDILNRISTSNHVIFTTAYNQYAVSAFDYGAVDYLLKPYTKERFNRAVDRTLASIRNKNATLTSGESLGFYFKSGKKHYLFSYPDILCFSSAGKCVTVHTTHGSFKVPELLKAVEARLPEQSFMRIHRQFVVNLTRIVMIKNLGEKKYMAYLNDQLNTNIPVGRKYIADLKVRIKGIW